MHGFTTRTPRNLQSGARALSRDHHSGRLTSTGAPAAPQANAIAVGSSPRPMSIDLVTALGGGAITTLELDALHATQMLPSGLSATAVGMWLGWVNDDLASVVVPAPSGIVAVTRRLPV